VVQDHGVDVEPLASRGSRLGRDDLLGRDRPRRTFTDSDQALAAAGLEAALLGRLKALPPRGVLKIGQA
jgi:hypothetical protein